MSDSEQAKVCPMCAESVKAAAKVCPHCRHPLVTWSWFNPNINATLVGLLLIAAIAVVGIFLNRIVGRKDFEPYRTQLSVLESTVSQRITSNGVYVVISGILTNGSEHSWKNIVLEAQLFGHDGKMLEVIPGRADYYSGVVAPSHTVAAFKIESRTSRSMADFSDHKVFVRWGSDATSWP